MSVKQYKQTKLPQRFRKKSSIELTFHLNIKDHAYFLDAPAKDGKYLFQVKWPEINQLMNISCDSDVYESLVGGESDGVSKSGTTWGSILKSHLQKTVRRQITEGALATTKILLELDPIMLLRRLPIIVVEDCYLFNDYPTLVWLMIFYTNYPEIAVGKKWKNWVLSVVRNLCEHTPVKDKCGAQSEFHWKTAKYQMADFSVNEKSLIYALQLRRIYGGMNCDQRMLNWFSLLWIRRILKENQKELDILKREWPLMSEEEVKNIPELSPDNFCLAGIDFHCCPWMIRDIRREYPEFSEDILRETIWHASSGVNVRIDEKLMPDLQLVWDTIYKYWSLLVRRILSGYLT